MSSNASLTCSASVCETSTRLRVPSAVATLVKSKNPLNPLVHNELNRFARGKLRQERMMVGYLDHELAHVAFSDSDKAGEFERQYPGSLGMLNVVEDARIERDAMARWPGVRRNLDIMFEVTVQPSAMI